MASKTNPGQPESMALPRVGERKKAIAAALYQALLTAYPDAHCELNYTTPHELLVATILSAQATDVSVNKATPALFRAFPTPSHYAAATPQQIEPYIKTIGLFRGKAKSIQFAMRDVVERYGGQVPRTMEELLTLRGVARKTANVVLGNCFGINVGFVVDTHVHRLAQRYGLVDWGTPVAKVERVLMAAFTDQRPQWCKLSHMLIWHGRYACKARGVQCEGHEICRRFGASCELRVSGTAVRPRSKAKS